VSQKRKRKEAKRAARKGAARGKQQARGARAEHDAEGRVHLIVHQEAAGGPERLSLSAPLFHDQWQNEVAVAAAHTAHGFISHGRTVDQTVGLGRKAMAATSTIVDGVLAQSTDRVPACHAGCAHCCHQAVGVSPPEVFAIHAYLRDNRTPDQLAAVVRRLRDADDRTRGMPSADRLSPDHPCPFLDEQRCSIYEVRPLTCRGTNSLDAVACERTLREPEAHAGFLAGTFSVPCFVEPIRAFHAVAAGVQLALHELHGLRVQPLELTAAMRIVVDDPERVATEWLAGEDPFREARGGDTTDDPLIAKLSGRRMA